MRMSLAADTAGVMFAQRADSASQGDAGHVAKDGDTP